MGTEVRVCWQVGETCGFVMEEDKLRIPSTKRVCFVGRKKNHDLEVRQRVLGRMGQMLMSSSPASPRQPRAKNRVKTESSVSSPSFVPRKSDIPVRNCTQIDKCFQSDIVSTIASKCLEQYVPLRSEGEKRKPLLPAANLDWNVGSPVPLGEAAALLRPDQLRELKSSCGGLQTLLRNHGHVFVVSSGRVRLRCYALDEPSAGRRRKKASAENLAFKRRPCWFHNNHPQGCPVAAEHCTWAHGKEDLCQ